RAHGRYSRTRRKRLALAAPGGRRFLGVLLGDKRQRQKVWLGDIGVLPGEMQPSHLHGAVSLRIRVLIDRAEDFSFGNELSHVLWIIADDEFNFISAVALGEVHRGAGLMPLHDEGVELAFRKPAQ